MRHFADTGLVAIDLANTWDPFLAEPERLPTRDALRDFCAELGEQPGDLDLDGVRQVRSRLREVLASSARTDALAAWAAALPARAAVVDESGLPVLRLAAPAGSGLPVRLAVRAVAELLDLAAAGDWERLRQCAADPCTDAFVDRSRPGRRQFCSTRCANRAHAAASRARHRTPH
ncbi:CGNR zinc finger domain-containing protein [Nonomuraea sediminis]|uniref:CGNR zinc finger domain-containing protein n=1 Tax=Nonomuraea sediminis TaxID=2835864 RepID=UPI001BDBCA77|nr:CGNR zinc finger domain-containing protein [Nonomuraea sediminis]